MIYNRSQILLVALLLLTSVSVDLATAQVVRKERRRDFIENLLRAVIESQVDSQDARNPGQITMRPGQPGVIVQPGRPQVVGSPQMIQVRQFVNSLSDECDHLIQDLRAQSGTVPQVLPLLGDAIQLRASINVFQQQCAAYPNIEPVRQRMISLDRNWRVLNHRLRQIKQLSPECTRCLDRCQVQHQKLCDTFQLQPQFQRRELARLVNEMHARYQASRTGHLLRMS